MAHDQFGPTATTKKVVTEAGVTIATFDDTAGFTMIGSAVTPAAVGTAAAGTSGHAPSRDDHVHPTGAGTPSTQAFGDAAATGTGPAAAMTDHKHAMPGAIVPVGAVVPISFAATPNAVVGTWVTDTAVAGAIRRYNSSAAQNDSIDYIVYLSAGTYTLDLWCQLSASAAIATGYMDGVSVGTADFYDAALLNFAQKTIGTGISVATTGAHTIRFKAATKNASSGNWYLACAYAFLYRTA